MVACGENGETVGNRAPLFLCFSRNLAVARWTGRPSDQRKTNAASPDKATKGEGSDGVPWKQTQLFLCRRRQFPQPTPRTHIGLEPPSLNHCSLPVNHCTPLSGGRRLGMWVASSGKCTSAAQSKGQRLPCHGLTVSSHQSTSPSSHTHLDQNSGECSREGAQNRALTLGHLTPQRFAWLRLL
jgi:hypothetical protein